MEIMKQLAIFCLLMNSLGCAVPAQPLKVTFIGNEAVEITDGKVSLLSDFPYQSGAFGYMTYDMATVRPAPKVLCLITHHHADHFDQGLFEKTDWTLAAPPAIAVKPDAKRLPFVDTMLFEGIKITAIPSPHTPEHHAYRVEWREKNFFFPGDTESTDVLPKVKVDVLFITPWLYQYAQEKNVALNGEKVVIYHHTKGEKVDCAGCLIPQQGEVFYLK